MTARWVESWSAGRIAIIPWQAQPARMFEVGLTVSDTADEVWIIMPNGQVKGGVRAANEALKYVQWASPLALLYELPLFRQLEELFYRWLASNRHRFPGVTAACEADVSCL